MMRRGLWHLFLVVPLVATFAACGDSGDPAAKDAKDWIGKTFLIDTPQLPPRNWVEPKNVGGDIGFYVPQFLIGVEAGNGSDLLITLTTTLGDPQPGAQDKCVATTQVTASGADYPNIEIVADSFPMRVYDDQKKVYVSATAHDLKLKNVLPGNPDAATAELIATVDVEDLYSLFYLVGPNPTKDDVCLVLKEQGGISCASCAHNGRSYCLTLRAVQVQAELAATAVEKITSPSCP